MALPSSGAITLAQIQTEFGGTNPIGLNEYYKGQSFVSANDYTPAGVPTSGVISLANFYGAKKNTLNTQLITASGTFTMPSTTVGVLQIYIVGGGGGGGAGSDEGGGGGGAGGFIQKQNITVPAGEVITVTIGAGGAPSTSGGNTIAQSTTLGTVTALGGGRGGFTNGTAGGSGGGGGGAGGFTTGGAGLQPSEPAPSTGFGNAGGNCPQSDNYPGGGGGGAGSAGTTGYVPYPGTNGGSGIGLIAGNTYAAGGSGRRIGETRVAGAANSGNGGDGSWGYPNKSGSEPGGSGVVIIQGYW